jgi:hypothetical protein
MKLIKISLTAVILIASSAFAIENTKISGDAKLFYGVIDDTADDYFDKTGSYGDMGLHLNLATDLKKGVSFSIGMQVVTTLGLENNLVDEGWSGTHGISEVTGNTSANHNESLQVDTASWVDEAWIATTALDTTFKIGRQELDTPLAFSETWGVDKNTFEAMVLVNKSFSGTALIAAYVGKSNGSADEEADTLGNGRGREYLGTNAEAGYVAGGGAFTTFASDGAYSFSVINNSWESLKTQFWYYNMTKLAKAYWLQADLDYDGILVGFQAASTELNDSNYLNNNNTNDTSMSSMMLGFKEETSTLKFAYSIVGDGVLGMANAATGTSATSGGESKLYTEMWASFGVVSAPGAKSWSITTESISASDVEIFAGYYKSKSKKEDKDVTELTFTAAKHFATLETEIAVIFADETVKKVSTESSDVQLLLTYKF